MAMGPQNGSGSVAQRFNAALERLAKDLGTIHTGRATLALLANVRVDGRPLQHFCTLAIPDSRTLQLTPWDVTKFKAVEQAITKANLGTVSNDGRVITLAIPPLSGERRLDLAKTAETFKENCLVTVRQVRRDALKEKRQSEDDTRRYHKSVEDTVAAVEKEINGLVGRKVKEVMGL